MTSSNIFYLSVDITWTFSWLPTIPQLSESIFNVVNCIVVPASCILKNSVCKYAPSTPFIHFLCFHIIDTKNSVNKTWIWFLSSFYSSFNLAFFFLLSSSFFFLLQFSSSFPLFSFSSSCLHILPSPPIFLVLFQSLLTSPCSEIKCSNFKDVSYLPVLLPSCLNLKISSS